MSIFAGHKGCEKEKGVGQRGRMTAQDPWIFLNGAFLVLSSGMSQFLTVALILALTVTNSKAFAGVNCHALLKLAGVTSWLDRHRLRAGHEYRKLVVITHQLVAQQEKTARLLNSPYFRDVPKIILVDDAYPDSHPSFAQCATLRLKSLFGEINARAAGSDVYLAGGLAGTCLERTAHDLVTNAIARGLKELRLHVIKDLSFDPGGYNSDQFRSYWRLTRRWSKQPLAQDHEDLILEDQSDPSKDEKEYVVAQGTRHLRLRILFETSEAFIE